MSLCFLANAHHPGTKAVSAPFTAALARPYSEVGGQNAHYTYSLATWATVYGEAYAFSGERRYAKMFQRLVDDLLKRQDASGWFIRISAGKPELQASACAAEALFLAYVLDYRRNDVAKSLATLRGALRASYNKDGTENSTFRDSNWNYAHFLVLTRFTGDLGHPYIPTAKEGLIRVMQKLNPDSPSSVTNDRPFIGEAASIMGRDMESVYRDALVTPFLAVDEHGFWKIGSSYGRIPSVHANLALALQGTWRYDWREVDKLAAEIRDAAR
jgi:hypothetical protein